VGALRQTSRTDTTQWTLGHLLNDSAGRTTEAPRNSVCCRTSQPEVKRELEPRSVRPQSQGLQLSTVLVGQSHTLCARAQRRDQATGSGPRVCRWITQHLTFELAAYCQKSGDSRQNHYFRLTVEKQIQKQWSDRHGHSFLPPGLPLPGAG